MAPGLPALHVDVMEADPRYVAARRDPSSTGWRRSPQIVPGSSSPAPKRCTCARCLTDIGIAPYATDGDLALDPTLLGGEPALEDAMRDAGLRLLEPLLGRPEPGRGIATTIAAGEELVIPIDLIVQDGAASGGGRSGARAGHVGQLLVGVGDVAQIGPGC